MPVTSMDKDRGLARAENQIGLSGEVGIVKPVSISCGMKQFTDKKLRCRILAAYPSHVCGPLLGCQVVNQPPLLGFQRHGLQRNKQRYVRQATGQPAA